MKVKHRYQCEYCLSDYETQADALKCEAECLKITMDEYMEYKTLLKEERDAFGQASCMMNDKVRERCDNTVRAVIKFQEEHGITDSKW